jgi:hypothetical protein
VLAHKEAPCVFTRNLVFRHPFIGILSAVRQIAKAHRTFALKMPAFAKKEQDDSLSIISFTHRNGNPGLKCPGLFDSFYHLLLRIPGSG